MRFLVGAIVAGCAWVGAGCYGPELSECRVRCERAIDCAPEHVCGDDGWCASPEVAGRCAEVRRDASTAADVDGASATIDASSLCQLGCSAGTCVDGVCVIDCSARGSCSAAEVVCPFNLPCRVVCGDNACREKVRCENATSCDVRCEGDGACAEEIRCGDGRCNVACSGVASCAKKVVCKDSCACDVACTGTNSCAETHECHDEMTCRLGDGCTSQLAGCDDC